MASDKKVLLINRLIDLKEKNFQVEKEIGEIVGTSDKSDNLDQHMKALHDYNEIKDAAQTALGALANLENLPISRLYDRFDLPQTEEAEADKI